MDLNTFYEREGLKNKLAHTMKFIYEMEPRDEILDPATDRMLMLVQDVMDILKKHENDARRLDALVVFNTLMRAIMTQDILIQLQEEELNKRE
jgi:hypothetical protein